MKLKFKTTDVEYTIKSINAVQDYFGDFFKESLYMFYPQFDRDIIDTSNYTERIKYMSPIIKNIYNEKHELLINKTVDYQHYWDQHAERIQSGLEDVFEVSLDDVFNDMEARVGINPVGSRYLEDNAFDAFYLYSPEGMTMSSLHEIIHFIWFYVWNKTYQDDISEYENPHLKWVVSEMVVDLIIKEANLSYLNPDNKETIYPYFHDIRINGKQILLELESLISNNNIIEFMSKVYELCKVNETTIRNAMY